MLGGKFGRGVVLARLPDGRWSDPVFITLAGGGVGWQIGIGSTDVVLVFKTRTSIERLLQGKGKLTLGGDVTVAAGPVGRQAEASTMAGSRRKSIPTRGAGGCSPACPWRRPGSWLTTTRTSP